MHYRQVILLRGAAHLALSWEHAKSWVECRIVAVEHVVLLWLCFEMVAASHHAPTHATCPALSSLPCSICTFTNIQTRDMTITVTMTVHITLTISLFVTASVCQKHFLSLLPKLEVEKILNYKVVFLLHLSSRSTSSLVCVRTLFLELWGICPHD